MPSGLGTATLNFGSHPGTNETSVFVSIGTIPSGASAEAYFMRSTTSDHTPNDHSYANLLCSLTCDVTASTGINIHARSSEKLTGQFTVQYVWTG